MEQELRAAASWWGEQIRRPGIQDAGLAGDQERELSIRLTLASPATSADDAQIRVFEDALVEAMHGDISEQDYWHPDNPAHFSEARVIRTEYRPCWQLRYALERAGLSWVHLPIKTAMRVDPGHVSARLGYSGSWMTVWASPPKKTGTAPD